MNAVDLAVVVGLLVELLLLLLPVRRGEERGQEKLYLLQIRLGMLSGHVPLSAAQSDCSWGGSGGKEVSRRWRRRRRRSKGRRSVKDKDEPGAT